MSSFPAPSKYAKEISKECWRQTSIPVSVGIAPTKTLAKIASKLCKRYPKLRGGCYMHRPQDIEKVLKNFPSEDVWGIGRRMMRKLEAMGVRTAWDYASLPETTVRMLFHLPGYRTWKELKGIPCIALEDSAFQTSDGRFTLLALSGRKEDDKDPPRRSNPWAAQKSKREWRTLLPDRHLKRSV